MVLKILIIPSMCSDSSNPNLTSTVFIAAWHKVSREVEHYSQNGAENGKGNNEKLDFLKLLPGLFASIIFNVLFML